MKLLSTDTRLWITENLDWLVGIGFSVFVGLLGITSLIDSPILASVTLFTLGLLCAGALRDRENSKKLRDMIDNLQNKYDVVFEAEGILTDKNITGIARVIPNTVEFDWLYYIQRARTIKIAHFRFNFTENARYYAALENVLVGGACRKAGINQKYRVEAKKDEM